ncbi:MAG: hypothetical protein IKB70_05075 [Bacilli bacterium]|nr:hypothetical protein [Bacilli bacterium]
MTLINFLKPNRCQIDVDGIGIQEISLKDNKGSFDDVSIELMHGTFGVDLYVNNFQSQLSHIYLTYKLEVSANELVFGDAIERGYGDMIWSKVNKDRQMFWYVFINNYKENILRSFGVNVQPNSFVSFKVDGDELFVNINVQSGGIGVSLNNSKLKACTFIEKVEKYENLLDSCKDFLQILMCDVKKLELDSIVYGFNNWYYAYGESSYSQIIKDTELLIEVTRGLSVKPYMVIDDGWSKYSCSGPWVVNNKFKDMKKLANEIKKLGARPGIWFRPLKDCENNLLNCKHPLRDILFDPTCDEVLDFIYKDTKKFVDWGYELIKFDFVTVDIFLNYGFEMPWNLCEQGWRFKYNNLTNAQIIKKMYEVIRKAAGKAVLIGCNAVSHLCVGFVELNRIGDDTSGAEFERTRKYGVNSLAYRLIQDDIFYKIDADCVGVRGEEIPWIQNKQWLDLLSRSSSPLFVSCDPDKVTDEIKVDLIEAFKINQNQNIKVYPLDWFENLLPCKYLIDNIEYNYYWFLLDKKC